MAEDKIEYNIHHNHIEKQIAVTTLYNPKKPTKCVISTTHVV